MKRGWLDRPSALWTCCFAALFCAETAPALPIGADPGSPDRFPQELREKIKYVIVIYPENRSFDSLYGQIRGVNGLAEAEPENYVQVMPDGTPFASLPQPNTSGIPGITAGPDPRFPASIPNAPFAIDPNVPINARHGDLVHRYYTEQYQINNRAYRVGRDPKSQGGAPLSKFSAYSDNPGLVLGHYDAEYTGEGEAARQYALADNAFHSAFGGSFLNHQWLIAARTPVWPAHPPEGAPPNVGSATVFDANGYPAAGTTGSPSDGALTNDPALPGFPHSNTHRQLAPGDYWAVNTLRPLRGPAGGNQTISPVPPPPAVPPAVLVPQPTSDTPVASRLPLQYQDTIGDRLSAAKLSWVWYAGGWDDAKAGNANYLFQFHHQPFAYFAKYALAKTPVPASATAPAQPGVDSKGSAEHLKDIDHDFYRDLEKGTLPRVSFVKPIGENNAHPGYATVKDGGDFIRKTLQKIQASRYWNETAVFIMYDEHGGLWDHVTPPVKDFWGPGLRVPLIVVSPFAKNGFVDHTQYETVSLLKFIEGLYGLKPLNSRDAAALAPVSSFKGQPDLVIKAEQGTPFTYQLPAYNRPYFFFVIGDADGLYTDPFTGRVLGVPQKAGRFYTFVFVPGQESTLFYSVQFQVVPAGSNSPAAADLASD